MPPARMLLLAVNVGLSVVVLNDSVEAAESADVNATSDGEFTRVGTLADGGNVESFGNAR